MTQWFDVVTTNSIKREYESVKQNPPNLAVLFFPQEEAYLAHAQMKNQKKSFYQERILNYFLSENIKDRNVFLGCDNINTNKKQYKSNVINFESFVNYSVVTELIRKFTLENNYKMKLSVKNQDLKLRNTFIQNSSENRSFQLQGNVSDMKQVIDQLGMIVEPGFQSVCYFAKKNL